VNETTKTIQQFIEQHHITMSVSAADRNPHNADDTWAKDASHWLCTMNRDNRTDCFVCYFSQGSAHRRWRETGRQGLPSVGFTGNVAPHNIRTKFAPVNPPHGKESVDLHEYRKICTEPIPPDLASVLDCLISDASGYDNAKDFEDWCSEYGSDPDSRKAEATYRLIGEQAKRLRHFLGDEAYRELMYEVERM
jgi:hypothetical protein